jgi:hypothetical protein
LAVKKLLRYCGLAALLAGAALYFSDCGEEPTGPEPVKSVWEWVPTPKCLASVNDIYFVSANDGWAVAGHQIWHYDGAGWKLFKNLHPANPRYDYGLTQVWFNGPNDGWFAGMENRTSSVYVSKMWHYDGAEFKEVTIPNVRFIYKMHFNAPDDGWAFGGDYALRFDGSKWYQTEFRTLYWSGCFFWDANDGWAVSMGGVYKWNGYEWNLAVTVGEDTWLNCIGFTEPGLGWALGEEAPMSGSHTNAWRWNGIKWEPERAFTFANGGVLPFYDIQFLGPGYGWAVGIGTWHWDGAKWTRYDKPPGVRGKGFEVRSVFCIDENDVWAGGTEGNIIHFKGFGGG